MKKLNIISRFTALVLCFVMVASLFACTSTQSDVDSYTREELVLTSDDMLAAKQPAQLTQIPLNAVGTSEEVVKVVTFKADYAKGKRILESNLEIVEVALTDLPEDPITSVDDVVGKYLLNDVIKGECVSASMLTTIDPLVNDTGLGEDYVIITTFINQYPEEKDMAVIIQKAIDENPGKTIYFPDGKYNLGKTVVIPSAQDKSVSFRLSNYATFGPATTWDRNCTALIQYGTPEDAKTLAADHTDYIMGGTFDCDGTLTAIEIYGGGRLFVNNIAIENAKIGVHIKPNGAYNNLENINITGKSANATKGIFVEGTNNSLINMRIYRVLRGVHLTGGDNVLINIHPLFSGTNSANAIGFHDESTGNRYNICYSDQFMIGFKMSSHTRSYYDTCYAYWWSGISYQIGFLCEGAFNSVISDTIINATVTKSDGSTESHYICFVEEPEESDTQNNGRGGLDLVSPSGAGKIVNAKFNSRASNNSKYHEQFAYNYN